MSGITAKKLGWIRVAQLGLLLLTLVAGFAIFDQIWIVPQINGGVLDVQGPASFLVKLDPLRTPNPSSKAQTLVFGASTTIADALRASGDPEWRRNSFPSQLQELSGENVRVYNFGFNGALPGDIWRLSHVLEFLRPQTVVVAINLRHFATEKDQPALLSRPWLAHHSVDKDFRLVVERGSRSLAATAQDRLKTFFLNTFPAYRHQEAYQLALFGTSPLTAATTTTAKILGRQRNGEDKDELMIQMMQKAKFASISLHPENLQLQALKQTVRNWSARGSRVLVLHSADNPEVLPELVDLDKYETDLVELERVVKELGADFLRTESQLEATEFVDTTHLTGEGNRKLAKAVLQQLATQPLPSQTSLLNTSRTERIDQTEARLTQAMVQTSIEPASAFTLTSWMFFVFVLALFSMTYFVRHPQIRHAVYVLLSLAWLLSFQWSSASIVLFLLLLSIGFGASQLFIKVEKARTSTTLALALIFETVIFVLLNRYSDLGSFFDEQFPELPLLRVVGISYIFFRMVQVTVDAHSGDLRSLDPIRFLSFMLGFLTLLAGPVTRYQDYSQTWERDHADQAAPLDAIFRILLGFGKVLVLAPILHDATRIHGPFSAADAVQLLTFFYGYAIYVYMDFSGYCDIVIGAGNLIGLRLPENFNSPFLSPSPALLWKRWHISFTDWLQSYVFNPVMKVLTRSTRGKRPLLTFSTAYFLAFSLAGIWHGTKPIVLWGFVTAFAIVSLKYIEFFLQKRFGRKKVEAFKNQPWFTPVAVLLTAHFTFYSFSIIGVPWNQMIEYHQRLLSLFQ